MNEGARLKALLQLVAACLAASAQAAPTEWLDGTVLAECEYCRTDAFRAERRAIANQTVAPHDPASATGYIVTMDGGGPFIWGRAALVGTGNLLRTDAHVLFTDTGRFKTTDGKVYFAAMHHDGPSSMIELDLSSVQRGGTLGPLETDIKNDWAIARLREDAIEKFNGDRVFAFLWDLRLTHDDIAKHEQRQASTLVLSGAHSFAIHRACQAVTDDHPSRYWFGVEEIFFIRCPSELMQAGSSGSALAISSPDGTWSLGGQIVAGETGEGGASGRQLFLGNVPKLREMLTIVYLQELIRRGRDPRNR